MAFLAAAPQRGLPWVLLSPLAYWVFDEALEVRQVSHRHRLDRRRGTSARSAALELADGSQGLLVVAVAENHPAGGLPAMRRSSAVAAATSTLSTEGLEHEFT